MSYSRVGSNRAFIYARYSSELQRDASIEDQVRVCRTRAEREGWQVINVFADHALSGATTLRPAYQTLLGALRHGGTDIVLAESLDRFSRDQEHIAAFFKQVSFAGARIVTLAEGDVTELHVGLKGTMGALYLKDLSHKTHRGLEGKVRSGRSVGTTPYGYTRIRRMDDDGQFERGLRRIEPAPAAIVRRIFVEYASGRSPLAISKALNAEGVAGPSGKIWYDATIRGRPGRGDGILRNQIYIGRQVWNRRHRVKDPVSGTAHLRANNPDEIVVQEVPELRIIDQSLWERVQARLAAEQVGRPKLIVESTDWGFWHHRRPRHLLTGKVVCGLCGALFKTLGQDYLGCRAAAQGSCRNGRRVRRSRLEAHVFDVLSRRLMDPELVTAFVKAFTLEWNRILAEFNSAAEARQREVKAIERKIANVVDAISDGLRSPELQARLIDLEARKSVLTSEREEPSAPLPALHSDIAYNYRQEVARLRGGLSSAEDVEALEAARKLIDRVIINPPEDDGDPPEIDVVGEFVAMLQAGGLARKGSQNCIHTSNVLNAFASSVKVAQGARLPGGGSRGAKPPLPCFPNHPTGRQAGTMITSWRRGA